MQKRSAKEARDLFEDAVSRDDDRIDLAEAALLIAAEEYPRLDLGLYIDKIDRIARLALVEPRAASSPVDSLYALNRLLFDELGFTGNTNDYNDPRNSFLNEVIDRRTGIPITLSVLYMEVAKRIGLRVEGVGMPMHFITRLSEGAETIYIDTFNGGRMLDEAGCAELLAKMSGGELSLRPEQLAPVSKKQILTRMLSNLLAIYASGKEYPKAIAAVERILLINPGSPAHVRDLGLLLAANGEISRALTQLELYLALSPEAADGQSMRERIKMIRQKLARLN